MMLLLEIVEQLKSLVMLVAFLCGPRALKFVEDFFNYVKKLMSGLNDYQLKSIEKQK